MCFFACHAYIIVYRQHENPYCIVYSSPILQVFYMSILMHLLLTINETLSKATVLGLHWNAYSLIVWADQSIMLSTLEFFYNISQLLFHHTLYMILSMHYSLFLVPNVRELMNTEGAAEYHTVIIDTFWEHSLRSEGGMRGENCYHWISLFQCLLYHPNIHPLFLKIFVPYVAKVYSKISQIASNKVSEYWWI